MNATLIPYLKEIGRGKDGMRHLTRGQAATAWGLLLDGAVSDLETGAFCMAMRIKGETAEEMAGFLDATHQRLQTPPAPVASGQVCVVLPSYNGARKLPLLTPLLGHLLQREGLAVFLHGMATEDARTTTPEVLQALHPLLPATCPPLVWHPTDTFCPGLAHLLDVRRSVGLRNSAHSLVKQMNPLQATPCASRTIVVGSYTHPEYAEAMSATIRLVRGHALLLRGTEGEAVADPRRLPRLEGFVHGEPRILAEAQSGSLTALPDLPASTDAAATAQYIADILAGQHPVPAPIARQVQALVTLAGQIHP